ncbi:MAG: amino acid ABC transporter permease [Clostridia bacterium]|nr:amino acid ABC transporter permease [Clostridia bacterium]
MLPALLKGLPVTLNLFAVTLVFSIPLGFFIALIRVSKVKILQMISAFYIWVIRGTPLLLQIFFIYFVLPTIGIQLNNFLSAAVAFVLNYAAYFAEIFRSGIGAIDRGQYEGAKALGFTKRQTMGRIIIPQMVRIVLPPVSNETITLVKDTALVSIVSLADLMLTTKKMVNTLSNPMPFAVAAVFYLAMTFVLTVIFRALEKRLCTY